MAQEHKHTMLPVETITHIADLGEWDAVCELSYMITQNYCGELISLAYNGEITFILVERTDNSVTLLGSDPATIWNHLTGVTDDKTDTSQVIITFTQFDDLQIAYAEMIKRYMAHLPTTNEEARP